MNEPQVKEALEKGIRAARRGRKEPAQRLLGQVVQAEPNNEEAWLWLARVIDQPADRAACLQRVIEINPNNSWAAEQLAELQSQPVEANAAPTPSMSTKSDLEISVLLHSGQRKQATKRREGSLHTAGPVALWSYRPC